jgi:thiamine biosynthesis lipoprotein
VTAVPATTRFAAWGTYVFLGVRDPRHLAGARTLTDGVLAEVDRTCSRFRDDSDLTRVNAAPGTWVGVDPLLAAAVGVALDAAAASDGLVDPLLGRPLVQLGYDRDFALLATRADVPALTPAPEPRQPGAWRQVEVDPAGAVRIPRGTALDLGATAKAWAADLVATAVAGELAADVLVSVGGDLRIAGDDPAPWPVGISERVDTAYDEVVDLAGGGLATSSTRVRRWSRSGARVHHLLDPRTDLPVAETWRTVTATGPTCVAANVASTAAIVLGTAAPRWLLDHGVTARLVASDCSVLRVGDWPEPAAHESPGRHAENDGVVA